MANFSALKTAIQNAIKQNGNEEITGDVLQQILLSIVNTMGDGSINTIEQNLSQETLARQNGDNTLQSNINAEALARGNADTQLQNAINAIKANIDNGYVYAGIATPSSTPVSGKVFYIATAAGTYTNFGGQVLTQGINILRFNGSAWSNQQLIGIDDVPTAGSNSFVKSGGVQNELALGAVYDVSAKNPTGGPNNDGKWESLSALLSDANLNTLIPTAYRKGGMSIKFVHTSDNKYVQFRYMGTSTADADFANTANWQGVDDEPTAGSDNLVKSGGVYKALGDISANTQIELTSYNSSQVRGYIRHAFKSGDKLELSLGSTPAIANNSLKVRYDDGTTEFGTLSNNTTKLFSIDRNTENVVFVLLKSNISGEGNVVVNARWGLGLDTELALSELQDELQDEINNLPDSYVDSESTYADAIVDETYKIVEGIKRDGTKEINIPTVFKDDVEACGVEYSKEEIYQNFSELTLDSEGHIVEGITNNGEKHISDFDDETKEVIKSFTGERNVGNVFEIPVLNANFTSPVPVSITGSKGSENAKYEFELPLKTSWLVRFKFRITEDLLNQNKNATIATLNGQTVTAKAIPLTQHKETGTYNGNAYSDNWPTVDGGIAFNSNSLNTLVYDRNIGGQAFSVKYTGSGTIVTLENNGSAIVLTVDGVATTYSFGSYNNVSELFEAMAGNTDLELQYIALDQRTCNELANFSAISLKDTVHTGVNGSGTITEQVDAAPFYLYYAVSSKWHQVEMFGIENSIYSVCDGFVKVINASGDIDNILTLGGECDVLFKDMLVCTDGTLDTEIVSGKCISSVTPYILIFEGHGMADKPAYNVTPAQTESGMSSLNPDTMEYFFSILEKKGYKPVSIEDVAAFYTCGAELPKRCYVSIFDDQRWQVCLDNNIRCVFNRHGAKTALALVTNGQDTIYHNGEVVTKEQAVAICKNADFSLVSHTKQHREAYMILPSEYISFLRGDIYDADLKGVNGSVLVYPGGGTNVYMHDVMNFLGFKLGIEITKYNNSNNIFHNRFMLSRINIGRIITSSGESLSPYTDYISKML